MNWIDNSLNIHAAALMKRSERAEIIASNVANSDTPGFKARDMDFKMEISRLMQGSGSRLVTSHAGHMEMDITQSSNLLYRVPTQPSENGNTVEGEAEQAAFTENAIRYQASIQFISSKVNGLKLALRGE